MKRTLGAISAVAALLALAACGSYNSGLPNTPTASSIKNRIFVSNQLATLGTPAGNITIVDGARDEIAIASSAFTTSGGIVSTPLTITLGGIPGQMVLTPDRKNTIVVDQQSNQLQIIDTAKETFSATISAGSLITSVVMLPDNKTGMAALRNAGNVAVFDITQSAVTKSIAVPTVRTLVLSHNGSKVLAFSDDVNTMAVIDASAQTATTINSSTFDHPVYGVFSSDDSKAYILSCGRECGGTAARVSVLDVASGTVSASVPVSAATVGLLDSSGNLYVAGTQGTAGKLDVLSASSLSVTKSGVSIGDGYHTLMTLGSNNRLFIGARTCNSASTGCLTIFNTSAGTAVVGSPKGDVTGMQPISGRNVVYVAEGGELRIYDTSKDAEVPSVTTGGVIDIVGAAVDIKAPDQT